MKISKVKTAQTTRIEMVLKQLNINYNKEFYFHPLRKWRSDFYLPDFNTLIEYEGGTFGFGRHNQPLGYSKDCGKYNETQKLRYSLLRYTADMIKGDNIYRIVKDIEEIKSGLPQKELFA